MPTDTKEDFQIDLRQSVTPWSRQTKICRGIWQYIVKPVYRLIPGKKSSLRIGILRMMGAQIGKECYIQQRVDILVPWNLILDDCVVLAHDTCVLNFTTVTIRSMTVISQGVHLCTGSHDYTHPHFPLIYKPIEIGAESWVASGAFVAPGVTLGRGCVIGANAVVTHDMPAWKVCAGNPCKVIKDRVMKEIA
ncbi:putative colanic acid biosynthesis acetyltransferase [Coraliomargarita sp. W4R53]